LFVILSAVNGPASLPKAPHPPQPLLLPPRKRKARTDFLFVILSAAKDPLLYRSAQLTTNALVILSAIRPHPRPTQIFAPRTHPILRSPQHRNPKKQCSRLAHTQVQRIRKQIYASKLMNKVFNNDMLDLAQKNRRGPGDVLAATHHSYDPNDEPK